MFCILNMKLDFIFYYCLPLLLILCPFNFSFLLIVNFTYDMTFIILILFVIFSLFDKIFTMPTEMNDTKNKNKLMSFGISVFFIDNLLRLNILLLAYFRFKV